MTHSVEKLENSTLRITLNISPEEFGKGLDKAFNKHKREFTLPGFRKGKAPKNLVFNRYGEAIFYEEALEEVVPPAYEAAIEEEDIKPYSEPRFNVTEVSSEDGATVEVELAVKPEIELDDYFGVKAYRPPVEVTDEQIDHYLEHKREELARMVPVEGRAVEEGDTVSLDYKGSVDGEYFDGGTAENQQLEIGSNRFIPGFEEQLIGHEPGEEFTIDVTFPEDYGHDELAGAAAQFEINLKEIYRQELPELDDDFVMDIDDECDTLEEYREKVKKELAEKDGEEADRFFENEVLRLLVEQLDVELPEAAIEDEVDRALREEDQQMRYYGLDLEKYLEITGKTLAAYREELKEPARRRLLSALVVDHVADKENIELEDADYEEEFKRLAEQYNMEEAKILLQFDNPDGRAMLTDGIRRRKAMDLLVEHAEVTDEKPEFLKEHEAAQQAQQAAAAAEEAEKAEQEETEEE